MASPFLLESTGGCTSGVWDFLCFPFIQGFRPDLGCMIVSKLSSESVKTVIPVYYFTF